MRSALLVARHEYRNIVHKRSFVLATLALPLLLTAIMALSIVLARSGEDRRPVGIVDLAGVTAAAAVKPPLLAFADQATAAAALRSGDLQAYYVLPADYLDTGHVLLFFDREPPGGGARSAFEDVVRAGLLADQPEAVRQRLTQGIDVTVRSTDGRREFHTIGPVSFLLPFAAGLFFVFVVMGAVGYLLQAVTAEKENRTVEIMATTMSPLQLVGGKAAGLLAVSLTQLAVWGIVVAVGLVAAAQWAPELREFSVPWSLVAIIALFFLPSYVLIAGMMIAVGSAVSEARQGQQIAGILNLLFIVPFFLLVLVFTNPNAPVLVALTLFPTTSFITLTMRWSVTAVPVWQVALSWVLLVLSAGASVWLAARVFRMGMLSYGQPLTLRNIVATLRTQG